MASFTNSVSLRLTDEQLNIIKHKAQICNVTVREYIRSIVLGYEPKTINVALTDEDRKVLYDFEEHVMPTIMRYNNALKATLLGVSEEERKKILLGKHNMKDWAEVIDIATRYVHKYKDYLDTIYNIK